MLFSKTAVGSLTYIPIFNKTIILRSGYTLLLSPQPICYILYGFWTVVGQVSLVTMDEKPFYVDSVLGCLMLFITEPENSV